MIHRSIFHMKQHDIQVAKVQVEDCIMRVKQSLASYWLCPNPSKFGLMNPIKTEIMLCAFYCRHSSFDQLPLAVDQDIIIQPLLSVHDLGVQLHGDMSISDQVSAIMRSGYYNIRRLCQLRSSWCRICIGLIESWLLYNSLCQCSCPFHKAITDLDQLPKSDYRPWSAWPLVLFATAVDSIISPISVRTTNIGCLSNSELILRFVPWSTRRYVIFLHPTLWMYHQDSKTPGPPICVSLRPYYPEAQN